MSWDNQSQSRHWHWKDILFEKKKMFHILIWIEIKLIKKTAFAAFQNELVFYSFTPYQPNPSLSFHEILIEFIGFCWRNKPFDSLQITGTLVFHSVFNLDGSITEDSESWTKRSKWLLKIGCTWVCGATYLVPQKMVEILWFIVQEQMSKFQKTGQLWIRRGITRTDSLLS